MLITAKFENKVQSIHINKISDNKKINKNKNTLTDISLLLNTSRKLLWKKITKEENHFYLILNEAYSTLKFEMFKNDFGYYTTQENIEKLKNFITENQNFLKEYVPFKEGINQITEFKQTLYKGIKDEKIKFIKNKTLFIIPIYEFNSKFYLKKEELTEAKKTKNEYKFYYKTHFLSLFEKINYLNKVNKLLSKNKFCSCSLEIIFDELKLPIKSENFNGQHFFSNKDLECAYYFVNEVKRKTENLLQLNKTKRQMKKYFFDSPFRLSSREKKICVKLQKINDKFYYNVEDKEKIKELFN